MPWFCFTFLVCLTFLSCNHATKPHDNSRIKVQKKKGQNKGLKSTPQLHLLPQSKIIDRKSEIIHEDIRQYTTFPYRHIGGYDTLDSQLKICKNVFTFFVENPEQETLKRFKEEGFPMEFWATDMCSFYGVQVKFVNKFLAKAKQMGFETVGYEARLITGKDTTSLIVSNNFYVHFDRRTAHVDINKILEDIEGIQQEGGSLDYAFVISVKSNKLRIITEKFHQLKNHPLVKIVTFIPEGCFHRVPILHHAD